MKSAAGRGGEVGCKVAVEVGGLPHRREGLVEQAAAGAAAHSRIATHALMQGCTVECQ